MLGAQLVNPALKILYWKAYSKQQRPRWTKTLNDRIYLLDALGIKKIQGIASGREEALSGPRHMETWS